MLMDHSYFFLEKCLFESFTHCFKLGCLLGGFSLLAAAAGEKKEENFLCCCVCQEVIFLWLLLVNQGSSLVPVVEKGGG